MKQCLQNQTELEYLQSLTEEERLAYIMGQQSKEDVRRVLALAQSFMSTDEEKKALSTTVKKNWILKHDNGYTEDELVRGEARKQEALAVDQKKVVGNQHEDDLAREFEVRGLQNHEKATEQAVEQPSLVQRQNTKSGASFSLLKYTTNAIKPKQDQEKDLGDAAAGYIERLLEKEKQRSYLNSDFAKHGHNITKCNQNMMHDQNSSVPYRGQVMPQGELKFAEEQGAKLEKILKKDHIDFKTASPADQAVLERADAARKERVMQTISKSEAAVADKEKKVMDSINGLRKGALLNALPDLINAKTPADIKNIYDSALANGSVSQSDVQSQMRAVGKDVKEWNKAVETHAKNLIGDGQEDKALGLLEYYQKQTAEINKKGFLDELGGSGDNEFSKKMKEMSESMSNMISNAFGSIKSLFGGHSPKPA